MTVANTVKNALWIAADLADGVLSRVVAVPLDVLDSINEKRALQDPIYVHLTRERAKASAEGTGVPWELFTQMRNLADVHANHPWWEQPLRAATRTPARRGARNLVHTYQRVTRGWSDDATWSLDWTLTRTLSEQLNHLADTTHTYPGTDDYPTYVAWQDALRENAASLAAYADANAFPDEEQIKAAQDALRWVADNLPHLWD